MIEGISAVTLGTNEMAVRHRLYRALGFEVLHATPVEGRDLSSRQTQYVVKDAEIGQPINSENCSEAADGVARESVKSCPRAGCGKSASPVRPAFEQGRAISTSSPSLPSGAGPRGGG